MTYKSISAYGILDFCKEIETAFNEGYGFDFDTNLHVPSMTGYMYYAVLKKSPLKEYKDIELEQEELKQETLDEDEENNINQNENIDDKQIKLKVGRPKKVFL